MSRELFRVMLIAAIIVAVLPLTMADRHLESYLLGVGLTALGLAVFMMMIGVILLLPKASRNWGKAVLLTSGLLLLAGFTVCSSAGAL